MSFLEEALEQLDTLIADAAIKAIETPDLGGPGDLIVVAFIFGERGVVLSMSREDVIGMGRIMHSDCPLFDQLLKPAGPNSVWAIALGEESVACVKWRACPMSSGGDA